MCKTKLNQPFLHRIVWWSLNNFSLEKPKIYSRMMYRLKFKQVLTISLWLMCGVMLVACGSSQKTELHAYIEDVLARPPGKIEPLPTPQPYQAYKYSSAKLRSPFMVPKKISGGYKPDMNRPKQELEAFALDALHLVGTVGTGVNTWALIAAPNGSIYKISVGGYLGRDYGRVEKIEKDRIEVLDTVQDGEGGWKQRPTNLKLEVKE